jgi:predicted ATP-grasp superfamily ATP-dependent carboligase
VLITGSRAAAALDLARDFAADGWEPHLADSVTSRMARWSKLAASHHLYPPPKQQGAAFRARICELVDQHRFDLVVPTCEEVFHLAAPSLHVRLGERLFAPALPTLRRLHDKLAFVEACRDWGLPAPESHLIENRADLAPFVAASPQWGV